MGRGLEGCTRCLFRQRVTSDLDNSIINVGPGICLEVGTDAFLVGVIFSSLVSRVLDEKETALVIPASSEIDTLIFLDDIV